MLIINYVKANVSGMLWPNTFNKIIFVVQRLREVKLKKVYGKHKCKNKFLWVTDLST